MRGLARTGQHQPEPALLDLGQQLVGALERLDLVNELIELFSPRLAQLVPVSLLNLRAADLGHEQVAAHPDATVDAPHRPGDSIAAKGPEPRQSMLVVGVHKGAVDVEDRSIGHGLSLPMRDAAMRCGGVRIGARGRQETMSSGDQYTPQDPTTQHTASDDLPGHKIDHPGLESDMQVEPDFGESTYRGSGRLEGKRASSPAGTPASGGPPRWPSPGRAPTS